MNYAVCCVPVAPVRIEPDHRSEMISQLLFGECCIITIAEKNGWIKIENKTDKYTGWCRGAHFEKCDEAYFNLGDSNLAQGWVNEIKYNGQKMFIPFGSLIKRNKKGKVVFGKNKVTVRVKIWDAANAGRNAETIQEVAFKFLNTAYLWGGKSVFGIDCSGFTQSVFKFLNIPLLRDAHLQATQGELVGFLQEARCGDLAFFDNEEGHIIHAGILLSNSHIIHAAGKVRIDKIDSEGIINTDTGRRTQKLRIIKRFL
jgi:gamma-D-glutamyl-L-lysine dipeptidyl-peptidase